MVPAPEEIAEDQADALWKVIDYNKDQLKPGTVEISQRWATLYSYRLCDDAAVTTLMCDREARHNSENDPRDHLTCCNKYDDGTTSTEHYPIPKETKKRRRQER